MRTSEVRTHNFPGRGDPNDDSEVFPRVSSALSDDGSTDGGLEDGVDRRGDRHGRGELEKGEGIWAEKRGARDEEEVGVEGKGDHKKREELSSLSLP